MMILTRRISDQINKRINVNTDIITRLDESPVFSFAERILANNPHGNVSLPRRGRKNTWLVLRTRDILVLDSFSRQRSYKARAIFKRHRASFQALRYIQFDHIKI